MKKTLLSITAAGLFAVAGTAGAATISFTFQPCGANTCPVAGATTFDWNPGNSLAIGGSGQGNILPVGTKVTNLYQANLGVVTDGTNNLYASGIPFGGVTSYFTVVAGFGEEVDGASATGNTFTFDPANPTNFFKVYVNNTAAGNNLAGTGFTAGTEILSGKISNVASSVNVNATTGTPPVTCPVALDGFNTNNYPGIQTICTTGGFNVAAVIDSIDTDYFPDLGIGALIVTALTQGNLGTPFAQTDPSGRFSSDGVANGDVIPVLGAINGADPDGEDFQFQADASSTFERSVPEPGSLALLGMALIGAAGAIRRKRSA